MVRQSNFKYIFGDRLEVAIQLISATPHFPKLFLELGDRDDLRNIFLITNLVRNHQYIGKDSHIDKQTRWKAHRKSFEKRNHYNVYFQNAWYKYNEKNFLYKIIEYCLRRN